MVLPLPSLAYDREVSGQLDVRHTIDDNVLLVEVAGAGDEHTLAGAARALAARALAARVEAGRAALSERERGVFTRFVLGGVAEELCAGSIRPISSSGL
jgi:hypothetical protein